MRSDLGDHTLLVAARRDPEAFGHLAARYLPKLRAWALRSTGDISAANDLAAETLARAWLDRRRYRGRDDGAARGWIFGIARNVQRERWRDERFEKAALKRLGITLPRPNETDAVHERIDAQAAAPRLSAAIETLPDAQRAALQLRVVDELPYPDVAARLERSENSTRLLVSRALARLRRSGIEDRA